MPTTSAEPLSYADFRTGLTFADVYGMTYGRKWKRRNGVLGYWRELKMRMYEDYLNGTAAPEYTPSDDPIPY